MVSTGISINDEYYIIVWNIDESDFMSKFTILKLIEKQKSCNHPNMGWITDDISICPDCGARGGPLLEENIMPSQDDLEYQCACSILATGFELPDDDILWIMWNL